MMDTCDEVCVFVPDNMKLSAGMKLEVEYAKSTNKKIVIFDTNYKELDTNEVEMLNGI